MSQTAKSRKLVSQLSKKYLRYQIRKLTNCQYSMKSAKRIRFQKNNDGNDKRQHNEICEDDNNNAFHVDDNSETSDSANDELNNDDDNNINVSGVVVNDINIYEIENNEMKDDFTTLHFAKWCKTLNVPMTHVNALLKDIRKHECFETVFSSDIHTILGTSKSTPLKIVPPGEYYHQGLINELVRVLSKYDIENVNLTLNIDGLPLSKSSGQQLWPNLVSVAGVQSEIMVGAYCGYKKPDDIKNNAEKGPKFACKGIV